MSQPNPALTEVLRQAAQLAAANGLDGETFKRAAYDAYLDARPGLREQLEDKQLKAQLRKLRKLGLVGSA